MSQERFLSNASKNRRQDEILNGGGWMAVEAPVTRRSDIFNYEEQKAVMQPLSVYFLHFPMAHPPTAYP